MENQQQKYVKKYSKGMQIGPLVLIQEFPEEQKWEVQCIKCGKISKIVRSDLHKYINKESCKNCGLILESKKYPNGTILGKIKIIKFLGKVLNSEKFLVECLNCHKQFEVNRSTITGYAKNPPENCRYCKVTEPKSTKYQVGEVINNCYELVQYISNGKWIVRCIHCGKEQEQTISNMKRMRSDQCFYCKHPYSNKPAFGRLRENLNMPIDERIYSYYKGKIESDNIKNPTRKQKEFKLTPQEFAHLIHSNCYYCGEPPTADNIWNKSGKRKLDLDIIRINGIDRIDSNKGYFIDNCVPCCPQCNRMKLDYTTEAFLQKIRQIFQYTMFNDQSKDVALSEGEMGDS